MTTPAVNAGVCHHVLGTVISFDEKVITFQSFKRKKPHEFQIAKLGSEQIQFMKESVGKLVDECVPISAVNRSPASVKKTKKQKNN